MEYGRHNGGRSDPHGGVAGAHVDGSALDAGHTTPSLPRRAILCVQQNPEIQQFLQRALSDFRVITATTAYEAVRRLNNEVFDAYVLDYWLSDWSGAGLCREIRKTDPHGPVCFYTTAVGGEHQARALRAGASAFIQAPMDAASLSRRLHALIQQSEVASLRARIE